MSHDTHAPDAIGPTPEILQAPKSAVVSEENERAILGAILLDPSLLGTTDLAPEEFYQPRHQTIMRVLRELEATGRPIDLRTIQARLEEIGQFEQIGGIAYLTQLDLDLPDIGRFDAYEEIVRDRAAKRIAVTNLQEAAKLLLAGRDLDAVNAHLLREMEAGQRGSSARVESSLPEESIARRAAARKAAFERRAAGDFNPPGIKTGLPTLDGMLANMGRGLLMLSAEPAAGKTTLAVSIAASAASSPDTCCLIVTGENSADDLWDKLLCARAGEEPAKTVLGLVPPERFTHSDKALTQALGNRLQILEFDPSFGPLRMRTVALALKTRSGASKCLIVVDYLQIFAKQLTAYRGITDVRGKVDTLISELTSVSRSVGAWVLAIASQNRQHTGTAKFGSLKESGDCEYAADVLMFLTRPEEGEGGEVPGRPFEVLLEVKKNRHGATGTIPLVARLDIATILERSDRVPPQSVAAEWKRAERPSRARF